MKNIEIPNSVLRTFVIVKQFWGKDYRRLRFSTQEENGRNPNKVEQEKIFFTLFDAHHNSNKYDGLERANLYKLFEYFKSPKYKKKKGDPNQISINFCSLDIKSTNIRNLTGSLDEETKVRTGFYASKTTKKYKRIYR